MFVNRLDRLMYHQHFVKVFFSVLLIVIPFIFLLLLILAAKISAHSTNKYVIIGSSWQHPWTSMKNVDKHPHFVTAEHEFL